MSNLEEFIRSKNITTNEFAEKVPCSRMVIWKVKRGISVSPKNADRIKVLTEGKVIPRSWPVGIRKS